jgi:cytochrome b6-f complex iron-sulfur subunit
MTEALAESQAGSPASPPLSRREFLNYLWGTSLVIYLAGSAGALLFFALPRFEEGEFGGVITLPVEQVPPPDSPPAEFAAGRFWLVNLGQQAAADPRQPEGLAETPGVKALYKVCVHLGCLYRWEPTGERFECPCHGSKYLLDGAKIDGPATRNLDVFVIEAVDAEGNVLAQTEPTEGSRQGSSLPIPPGTVALRVNTGAKIQGASSSV